MTQTAGRKAHSRSGSPVVAGIQDLILSNGLQPGDTMPTESQLMDALGVSRSSVREAMRTLASLDLVEVRHGTGTVVGAMSLGPMVEAILFRTRVRAGRGVKTLREVVDVRVAIDLFVAEDLCRAYAATPRPDLADLVDRMREKASRHETFAEEDQQFHAQLLGLLDNELVQQLGVAFWQIHSSALPMLGIPQAKDIMDTVNAHQRILDALEVGDVTGYRAAVVEHYGPLQRMLADHPEA